MQRTVRSGGWAEKNRALEYARYRLWLEKKSVKLSVGSRCDRACSLYGCSVTLIACASERTTQYDHKRFRSLVTIFCDHGQSYLPIFVICIYRTVGFRPILFTCSYIPFYVLKNGPLHTGTPATYAVCRASTVILSLNISDLHCVPECPPSCNFNT